jgi:hypothetical protein
MEEKNKAQSDNLETGIVFSKTISAGKRVYYLDVKKNRKGELFLSITESKKVFPEDPSKPVYYEKYKIFLYKEDFNKFVSALNEAIAYARKNNTVDFVPNREREEDKNDTFAIALDEPIHLNIDF